MHFQYDDGGRAAAGYRENAGDCVARSIAIAAELSYRQVCEALDELVAKAGACRPGWSSANGGMPWGLCGQYIESLGWQWTPKQLDLRRDRLPRGRIILAMPAHYTTVINGVIHDTFDASELGMA